MIECADFCFRAVEDPPDIDFIEEVIDEVGKCFVSVRAEDEFSKWTGVDNVISDWPLLFLKRNSLNSLVYYMTFVRQLLKQALKKI